MVLGIYWVVGEECGCVGGCAEPVVGGEYGCAAPPHDHPDLTDCLQHFVTPFSDYSGNLLFPVPYS